MIDLGFLGASAIGSISAVHMRVTMHSRPIGRSLSDLLPFTQFDSSFVSPARDGPHRLDFGRLRGLAIDD
jgi:hypothetical protein